MGTKIVASATAASVLLLATSVSAPELQSSQIPNVNSAKVADISSSLKRPLVADISSSLKRPLVTVA